MSELQIGLVAIGALVVAAVLIYNRIQERRAKLDAEKNFRSGHDDVLLDQPIAAHGGNLAAEHAGKSQHETPRPASRTASAAHIAQPDPAIDYIIEFRAEHPLSSAVLREQWN